MSTSTLPVQSARTSTTGSRRIAQTATARARSTARVQIVAPDLRIADGTAASVFRVAAARGPVSRDVAAKVTGLSIATVNRQVSALLSAGLLRERADLEVAVGSLYYA